MGSPRPGASPEPPVRHAAAGGLGRPSPPGACHASLTPQQCDRDDAPGSLLVLQDGRVPGDHDLAPQPVTFAAIGDPAVHGVGVAADLDVDRPPTTGDPPTPVARTSSAMPPTGSGLAWCPAGPVPGQVLVCDLPLEA